MKKRKTKVVQAPARTTRPLVEKELQMLEKGYASSRMVAQKLGCHFVTVLKRAYEFRTIRLGKNVWFEIESVVEVHEDAVELLELDDWSFPDGLNE